MGSQHPVDSRPKLITFNLPDEALDVMLPPLHGSVDMLQQDHDHLLVVLPLLVLNGYRADLVCYLSLAVLGDLDISS